MRRNPVGVAAAKAGRCDFSHARKWPRLRRRMKVLVNDVPALTVDLGGGGFSTELFRVQPPGTEVEGLIWIKGKRYRFRGLVAWSRPETPYSIRRGRMGVLFTEVPSEVRQLGNRGAATLWIPFLWRSSMSERISAWASAIQQ